MGPCFGGASSLCLPGFLQLVPIRSCYPFCVAFTASRRSGRFRAKKPLTCLAFNFSLRATLYVLSLVPNRYVIHQPFHIVGCLGSFWGCATFSITLQRRSLTLNHNNNNSICITGANVWPIIYGALADCGGMGFAAQR